MRSTLLIIDAIINLALGTFLVVSPLSLFQLLGLPWEAPPFYATILGSVLIGISIALLMGLSPETRREGWLGLGGAITINLFGGLALAALLVSGTLSIPLRGHIVLWGLVVLLTAISGGELLAYRLSKNTRTETGDEREV